jgi:hypothetical protein
MPQARFGSEAGSISRCRHRVVYGPDVHPGARSDLADRQALSFRLVDRPSLAGGDLGRPKLHTVSDGAGQPALYRPWIMARSNSANTPII